MALRIHLIEDRDAATVFDKLDAHHGDPYETFDRSEALTAQLLQGIADRPEASGLTPWLVLRGGLVAWQPLRHRRWGPIGMLVPIREGANTRVAYAHGPIWPETRPLLLDWILATGSTLCAAVRHVAPPPGSQVAIGVVLSCAEGEERLDALEGVDVDLYCFQSGQDALTFFFGFDIGDYAVGMRHPMGLEPYPDGGSP